MIRIRPHQNRLEARPIRMEIIPLIDIVFILLVFFAVVASTAVSGKGIKLLLPAAKTAQNQEPGLTVSLTANGTIYADQTPITLDQLRAVVQARLSSNPNLITRIQADMALDYGRVVRILDTVRESGCTNAVLETRSVLTPKNS